jgi:hypothetical protein
MHEQTSNLNLQADRRPAAMRRALLLAGVVALASLLGIALSARSATAATIERPLPASEYTVRPACAQGSENGAGLSWLFGAGEPARAHCLALALVPIGERARTHSTPIGLLYSTPATRARALAGARALARARSHARAGTGPNIAARATGAGLAAEGRYGLTPADLHRAYTLPESTTAAAGQLVAVVDAYADPKIESDLATYDSEFGLPSCGAENHCLSVVNLRSPSEPLSAEEAQEQAEWDQEISLDVETVHAVCVICHILLVEAASSYTSALDSAEETALQDGATEISNSWGAGEPTTEAESFNHPGVAITAAAGDNGYRNWMLEPTYQYVDYPAASPHVLAVGGTRLELGPNGERLGERVWNGRGATAGGCAEEAPFAAPSWQLALPDWSQVGCGTRRAVSDIAADADPYTGVAIYDSIPTSEAQTGGWMTLGGTSLASPLIAATIALAGGVAPRYSYIAEPLYENAKLYPKTLHPVVEGSNGKCTKGYSASGLANCTTAEEGESCHEQLICVAGNGFSGPVGLGTPNGYGAFAKPGSVSAPAEETSSSSSSSSTTTSSTTTTASTTTTVSTSTSTTTLAPTTSTIATASEGAGAAAPGASSSTTATTTATQSSPAPPPPSAHAAGQVRIVRFRLAPRTRRALRARGRNRSLRLRQVAFRALLSRPHRLRVALYRLLRARRGRVRPRPIGKALLLAGERRLHAAHLRGAITLPPGRYRLVVQISPAVGRSLSFSVR